MEPIVSLAWITGITVAALFGAVAIAAHLGVELRQWAYERIGDLLVSDDARQLRRSVRRTTAGLDELAGQHTLDRLQHQLGTEPIPAVISAHERLRGPVLVLDLGETLVEIRLHSFAELGELAARRQAEAGSLVELSYVDELGWCVRLDLDGAIRRCSGWQLTIGSPDRNG